MIDSLDGQDRVIVQGKRLLSKLPEYVAPFSSNAPIAGEISSGGCLLIGLDGEINHGAHTHFDERQVLDSHRRWRRWH